MRAPLILRRRLLSVPLLGGGVAACSAAVPGMQSPPVPVAEGPPPLLRPPLTYVALSASDGAGVGVQEGARDNWVAVLGRQLPQPTRVVNLSISGIRLHEALEVELPPALDARPQLVTVWLVVNDILSAVPLSAYRAGLDRLVGELRGAGAQVAVGNVPNAPEQSAYLGIPPGVRPALTGAWNEAIAGVVGRHGAVLVDLYRLWPVVEHPEYVGPDGLHPTVPGYRTIAETFLRVLREQRIV